MMSKKINSKKKDENNEKPEDNGEFIGGCYYAPWDF